MKTPNPALMRAYGTHEVFFKKASGGRRVVDAVSEKVAGEFLKKLANPQPGLLESVGLSLGAWMAKEAAIPAKLPRIGGLGGIHAPVLDSPLQPPRQRNVPKQVPAAGGPKVGPGPHHMDVEYAKAPPPKASDAPTPAAPAPFSMSKPPPRGAGPTQPSPAMPKAQAAAPGALGAPPSAPPASGVQAKAAPVGQLGAPPAAAAPPVGAPPAAAAPIKPIPQVPGAASGKLTAPPSRAEQAAMPKGPLPAANAPPGAPKKNPGILGTGISKGKALGYAAAGLGAYGIYKGLQTGANVAEGLANSGMANSQYGATPGGYYPPQYATN